MKTENLSIYATTTLMGAGIGLVTGVLIANWYHNKNKPEIELIGGSDAEQIRKEAWEKTGFETTPEIEERFAQLEAAVNREPETKSKEHNAETEPSYPEDEEETGDEFGEGLDQMAVYEQHEDILENYPEVTTIQLEMLNSGVISRDALIEMLELEATQQTTNYNKVVAQYGDIIPEDDLSETKRVMFFEHESPTPETQTVAHYGYDPLKEEYKRIMRDGRSVAVNTKTNNKKLPFNEETLELALSALSSAPFGKRIMVHDIGEDSLLTLKLLAEWPEVNTFEKFAKKEKQDEREQ